MDKKIKEYTHRFPSVKNLQITSSDRKGKRFTATFVMGGETQNIHFGLKGAHTFYDGATQQKMLSYRARASKIKNKYGQYTYKIPGTANSFAYWILW